MPIDQSEITEPTSTAGDGPSPPDGPDTGGSATAEAPRRKRLVIGVALAAVACLLLGVMGAWVTYSATDLPTFPTLNQGSRFQYADGSTFATLAAVNRTNVRLSDVPKNVQNAVIAAEEPDYWKDNGTAVGSTAKAIRTLITGRKSNADGSITEQYVQKSLNLSGTRKDKAKSPILARKLAASMSKDDILQGYLNTVYFGRSAWGIQAASNAYFNKDIKRLTPAEGAVLAGAIKNPTEFDPKTHLAEAKDRWASVLDTMVEHGFLKKADRAQLVYPTSTNTVASSDAWRKGSTGVLGSRIERELTRIGFTERDIQTGGLTVRTTISPAAQAAAVKASESRVNGQVQDPRMGTAMVSVDPATGAVKSYYGGDRGYGNLDLASTTAPHPAAASFEPFVLVAAVAGGYGIDSRWNGTSGQVFPDHAAPLANLDNDSSCGPRCSLTDATVKSLDTVFWALTSTVKPLAVAKTAKAAGIESLDGKPLSDKADPSIDSTLGTGQHSVSVLDQASAYATIANYGVYHQPYFVSQVLNPDGTVAWDHSQHPGPVQKAWSTDVGRDVSYVLQKSYQTSPRLSIGRPAATKPASQPYKNNGEISDAWMAGYTPQLATAVWVGSNAASAFPLRDKAHGNVRVYGTGIPGEIWKDYMTATLKSHPAQGFQTPLHAGGKLGNAATR